MSIYKPHLSQSFVGMVTVHTRAGHLLSGCGPEIKTARV